MYLISIYFDDKTGKVLQGHIDVVARVTGNDFMLAGNVPPHITVGAFETREESLAREVFDKVAAGIVPGRVSLVSVGSFLPSVIYVAPVLNEYLQTLSESVQKELNAVHNKELDIRIDEHYKPYSWFPHVTLGKKLSGEQLQSAFSTMLKRFSLINGEVVKIGLARTNPFCNLCEVSLKTKV